ncbi:MAG: hypothetical protein NC310_07620 [Roseburia sp.]|nr:hypothetical protein [Anaeroplasma bactoclasticum]MCM1196916.1 hypothetical protein [Roseburia sp.]MCM1556443.1 hypothetical protein [Anaeroplasma bactoclasticum]
MKKKSVFFFLAVFLLAIIVLGSTMAQSSTEAGAIDYDTAFYVDGSKNVFIVIAKTLDKCCFYVIDIIITSVGSVFNTILNN